MCQISLFDVFFSQLQQQLLSEQSVRAEEAQTHATQLVTIISEGQTNASTARFQQETELRQLRSRHEDQVFLSLLCIV